MCRSISQGRRGLSDRIRAAGREQVNARRLEAIEKKVADIISVDNAEIRLSIPQSKLGYLDLPRLGESGEGASIDLFTDVAGEVKRHR